jgi:RNA polymerase sigma factor (sigma-70 family)
MPSLAKSSASLAATLRDEELVRLIQSGECPAAISELLLRHYDAMCRLLTLWGKRARLRVPDQEDMQQEVLSQLLEASADYDANRAAGLNRCSFRTFLGTLMRHRFRDSMRVYWRLERRYDRAVRVEALLEQNATGAQSERRGIKRVTLSTADDPVDAAARRELESRLDAALSDFDGTARQLWERLHLEESLRAIAPLIGLSYDQAKRLRGKMRKALRKHLRDWQS